jgi:alkanesulfonate monooxygenase SsuD/methylene tetrahydromethanopterin reductase-like flavin-dependent oxidoreductase (luciferase family)
MIKLGITLPSFRESPEPAIEVARRSEAAGLDAVFAFDHLFRSAPSGLRPAIEGFAAETERISLGPLVARATLRPPATLAHIFDTVQRVSGGRLIAAIGAGDHESRAENESFGLDFGSMAERIAALDDAVAASMGHGYPVWVGGTSPAVRAIAARANGWNRWGGNPERFAAEVAEVGAAASGPCVISWGGLVVLGETEADANRKRERLDPPANAIVGGPEQVADRLREYIAAGAHWIIVGPVDSTDLDNPAIMSSRVAPLLA